MDSAYSPKNPQYPIDHSFYSKHITNPPLQLSSEWSDNYSPIPPSNQALHKSSDSPIKMSTTQTFEETPLKKPRATNDIVTPGKKPTFSEKTAMAPTKGSVSPSRPVFTPPPTSAKTSSPNPTSVRNVRPMDVLWAMINDVVGKDKLAKFGQYSLRLVLYHAEHTQRYLSDETVNIGSISKTHAKNGFTFDLLVQFIKDPKSLAKIVIILLCSVLKSRLSGVVPALGLYRQIMRFGKSPFRIRVLFNKLRDSLYQDPKTKQWKISSKLFTNSTLGDLIGLYYNFNDESTLLFKLKFLRNQTWKSISSRHESYAWYCDSWLALYNAYNKLQKYSQQEMDIKIHIQVKKRARTISRQVLGGNSLSSSFHSDDEPQDVQNLRNVQFQIENARLDIYKTLADIVFNSYTVFNVKLHFPTIQIWMGIMASFLSSVKLYREKKLALQTGTK